MIREIFWPLTTGGQLVVATGDEHRVRIDMPDGIEFEFAEIGNASCEATAAIKLDLENTYGQWNVLHQTGAGVVRN